MTISTQRKLKLLFTPLSLLLATWGTYFTVLFARMIWWNNDGIYVGHAYLWSDWALHIGMATTFAEKSPSTWFAYHPLYADGKMTYTFLTNLISGLLMRAGLSLPLSFIIPSIVLSLLLLLGIYILFHNLIGSGSKAFIGISIFLLSSGMGFFHYLSEWISHPSLVALIPNKPYSGMESYQWGSGNTVAGLLLPQRSILIGMTLAVWAMVGFTLVLNSGRGEKDPRDQRILVASGISAGLLPIAHMHSLIALLIFMFPLVLYHIRKWRLLAYGFIPTAALASTLYFTFIHGKIEVNHFMTWRPGFTATGFLNWIKFWLTAWGIMIPVATLSWIHLRKKLAINSWIFLGGSFTIFLLANLIYFQPIPWDNSKLFTWSYLGFSLLAADGIVRVWNKRSGGLLAILAFVLLTFTGALELTLLQRVDAHSFQLIGPEELALADQIRHETEPLARFLTAKDHNHPVMVRGARPILLGYVAWVINFGFDYIQTEKDIDVMFQGGEPSVALLRKHRVSYVVIGPSENRNFHPNETFFKNAFPIAFQTPRYHVYDVRSLSSGLAN